jgi:threonylcarbamoyladenosine tRNA methylthiotransferase CDKAL1
MLEIYFESYGCTANHNSTEIMKGLVRQAGLNITSSEDFADLIVINSCIVKEPTEEKIRRKVFDLLKRGKKVILTGCMPRLRKKKLIGLNNLYLLDTSHVKNFVNLVRDIKDNQYDDEKYLDLRNEVKAGAPKLPSEKKIGVTQISEGCFGECAYCTVRLAKGKLFSYPKEKIIESVRRDLELGCREIWLTSQDCANYGNDEGEYKLVELLKEVLALKGNFYVRVGMMNPDNVLKILDKLIEVYKNPKMFKFLHIPIQSGSDEILKSMKRKYSKKDVLKIAEKFKSAFPEGVISTDVIVGFPGESEKDFDETVELVKEIKPLILNRSNYGARPGTSAEKMKGISPSEIKRRATELSNLHLEICKGLQSKWLNKEVKVLVDKKGFEGTWLSRDENYRLFAVMSREKLLGKKVMIKVQSVNPHYLMGVLNG